MATGASGSGQPVQRFEVCTRNEAETEEFIRQRYIGNRSRFFSTADDGTRFTATVAQTADIAVSRVRSTVNFLASTDPFDYFLFLSLTNGRLRMRHGRDETILLAGENSFYPLGFPLRIDHFDVGVRTIQLPVRRLGEVAEQTAGIRAGDLRFESTTPVSPAVARQWSALIALAGTMLLADSPMTNPLVIEELTRAAALTALHTFPNTAWTVSYRPGPAWVAPAAVRRAAAFVQAHADQPITLEQIAEAAGVSARALQYAFRRHFDATPTEYLRRIRLERAAEQLQAADPGGEVTVAEVARRWGWASPSQFAAAYRRRFGVLPSHSLRM
jgi:AraC-like DNA-binding protein